MLAPKSQPTPALRRRTEKGGDLNTNRFRWRRWIAGAILLLAAYALAGFWLVPLAIKDQLPKYGQSTLARQASVGAVTFNPFTLRLVASDLRLAEADGAPLFSVGRFAAQLQWRSLVRRTWRFTDIRVTAPSANLRIAPDGKFNLAELLDTLERRPHEPSKDNRLPRIFIEQFALEQGRVDMRDQKAGYSNVFAPIDFALSGFSTLPDQSNALTFTAQTAHGGTLRWTGQSSLNPIGGSGQLELNNVSLPEPSAYLKPYVRARVASGRFSATLPYRFAYADGTFDARLAGARLSLRDLALTRTGATDAFAAITRLDVNGIDADLMHRQAVVGEVQVEGGKLSVQRDAQGELDLAKLMVAAGHPAAPPVSGAANDAGNWKLDVKKVVLDRLAFKARDETASPPVTASVNALRLQMQLAAAKTGAQTQLKVSDASASVAGLTLASGAQTPFKLGTLKLSGGMIDLAARRAVIGKIDAQGAQLHLTRDRDGMLNLMTLLPKPGAQGHASIERAAESAKEGATAPAARRTAARTPARTATQARARASAPAPAWSVVAENVELGRTSVDIADEGTGVKAHVNDISVKLAGVSADLAKPVKFDAAATLQEGGHLAVRGSVVPARAAVQADLKVERLALAPLQPLLARYVKLKLAGGALSAQGQLVTGEGTAKSPAARYTGAINLAGLALNEEDGEPFLGWQNVGAERMSASFGPNRLDIPELRLSEVKAKLLIENDRSFNAAHLLVQQSVADHAAAPQKSGGAAESARPPTTTSAANEPFAVRIRRVRLENAKLDFSDLSLRPQFAAKIYALNGVINGLSSRHDARSQIELDGRVDAFGLARVRGELNPFAPRNNTDLHVVFKNVDMTTASPYSMKFAGYRIAEGKMSLDLEYKIRDGQLEGANQIVLDNLTLGERVDSPDAIKLPLELAIAILKDSDGRIDLGLPVSGNINDPQFSYGALIWKAFGALVKKIVTAPFRALSAMLGGSGEKLEAVDFDPGSVKLLPPEREKLGKVAQVLVKRPQLKLSVPASYSEAADGAALRARMVRDDIARRTGVVLKPGEAPGPVDIGSRAVRSAVRDLYAARFGDAELEKQKKAAEAGTGKDAQPALPLWRRVGKAIQGEPQIADASAFYKGLLDRLNREEPLPPDALAKLGTQRAEAILSALKNAGIDATRAVAGPPEKTSSEIGKAVPVKLELSAK